MENNLPSNVSANFVNQKVQTHNSFYYYGWPQEMSPQQYYGYYSNHYYFSNQYTYVQQNQFQHYSPQQMCYSNEVANPQQSATSNQTKLSRNQKRKQKLRQKKQELQQEKRQIGDWVKYQSKPLIKQIETLEEQERKRVEKRKLKLGHLIEIGKQIFKLRKKLGLLRAETTKARMVKAMKIAHKKKPSMIKRMNEKYQKLLKKQNVPSIKQKQTETEWQNIEQQPEEQITADQVIPYPEPGKLTNTLFNNIALRQWVDHIPSQTLEQKVLIFINRLAYQQAVKKTKQPLKYKKRVVAGFNECLRTVNSKKSKLLVVALNIVYNPLKLSSDERTIEIIQLAKKSNIPIIHTSTRAKLGRAFLGKFGPRVSVASVINYEGSEESYQKMMEEWKQLQNTYNSY